MEQEREDDLQEYDEKASPDLRNKMFIVDANANMIQARAAFAKNRHQLRWMDFIKKLRELWGLIKFDYELENKKKEKLKDFDEDYKKALDDYLTKNKELPMPEMEMQEDGSAIPGAYENLIYQMSDDVSRAAFKAGVTDVKFRKGNPISRFKSSY